MLDKNSWCMCSIQNLEAYTPGMTHYPENTAKKKRSLTTISQVLIIFSAASLGWNRAVAGVRLCISAAHSIDSTSPRRKMSG